MTRVFDVQDSMLIDAPLERVFQLSTSVPLVQRTLGFRPVEGVTDRCVEMSSRVVWKGWLFGLPQYHETLITGYAAPHAGEDGRQTGFFQDTQGKGRFATFQHDHHMTSEAGGTLLRDHIRYSLPLGWAGALVARWIMQPFIRRILRSRFRLLQQVATGNDWQKYMCP